MLIAASGNDGEHGDPLVYPAAFPEVIGVGATDNTDSVAKFSTSNETVDVSAPGVDVYSTVPGGYFKSGTSMASPHVVGLAALVLAHNPQLGPDAVKNILTANAKDVGAPGRDDEYRLRTHRRVQEPSEHAATTLPQRHDETAGRGQLHREQDGLGRLLRG